MKSAHFRFTVLLVTAAICGRTVTAKQKKDNNSGAPEPGDQIVVNAHITVSQGPVTGFLVTQHHNRRYIYAARGSAAAPMLIDITRLDSPQVLPGLARTAASGSGDLVAAAGTVALAADAQQKPSQPQTLSIIDYSDPAHPSVVRRFEGVTAMKNDGGLILLANPEGIWILSRKLAADPDEGRRYANKVIYGESRY